MYLTADSGTHHFRTSYRVISTTQNNIPPAIVFAADTAKAYSLSVNVVSNLSGEPDTLIWGYFWSASEPSLIDSARVDCYCPPGGASYYHDLVLGVEGDLVATGEWMHFLLKCVSGDTTLQTRDSFQVDRAFDGNARLIDTLGFPRDTLVTMPDLAVTAIAAPTGAIDSTATVTPSARVRNLGDKASMACSTLFRVGSVYADTAIVATLQPGESVLVSFGAKSGWPRGVLVLSCSTMLAGDRDPANDKKVDSVFSRVRDARAVGISPQNGVTDSFPYNYPVGAAFMNDGNATTDTVPIRFVIRFAGGGGYQEDDDFVVAPGETVQTEFIPDEMPRGTHSVLFYTRMPGDMNRTDDTVRGTVFVQVRDKGIAQALAPRGFVYVRYPDDSTTITPAAVVANFGNVNDTAAAKVIFRVFVGTLEIYADSGWTRAPLGAGARETLAFTQLRLGLGGYRASVVTPQSDMVPANDSLGFWLSVVRDPIDVGWVPRRSVPNGANGKTVKDGGSLAFDLGSRRVYALKGNKTGEFYSYNPDRDSWTTLPALPYQQHPLWPRKAPKKGTRAAASGDGLLYVTQGNNSLGFWRYSVPDSSWLALADVPAGSNRVKGGTDLEYVVRNDTGYVYLLKGYRADFYRYSTRTGQWQPLPSAPSGASPKYVEGSFLVYDGAGTLYCHKAKYNELWPFSIASGAWGAQLQGMPTVGRSGRTKKSKDGGCGTRSGNGILALKGGNTFEFWRYEFGANTWSQLEDMPTGSGKKVKIGADIAAVEDGTAYGLKGNKTLEFYRYVSSAMASAKATDRPAREGAQASGIGPAPGPQCATVLKAGSELPVGTWYSVYNHLGVLVQKGHAKTGRPKLSGLPAGVYFLRFDAGGAGTSRKVVLTR
jgi:hypothetical protein